MHHVTTPDSGANLYGLRLSCRCAFFGLTGLHDLVRTHQQLELFYFDGKTMGKPRENGGLMGFDGIYPLVMSNITMENHNFHWENSL